MLEILPEPLAEGSLLDSYRLEHVLGAGGMGVVWAARDVESGQRVALKVLSDERAADPTQQARILREAAAAMRIDHPNVVKVSAVLETEAGVPFLVMEYLEGESLRAALDRQGKLPVEESVRIFGRIVDAVAAAHAAGIVHRDLKPENVFLLPDGGLKVLDFGIAKRVSREVLASTSLTETGAVIGTPHYMAPEQIFGDDDVDVRADVWSLGVMLYECLTGKRPTEADGFGQILKRITSANFSPLGEGFSPRLSDLVTRMLARDREKRPSIGDVRSLLGRIDEGPVSVARTAEEPKRPRSLPKVWIAVPALAALAIGIAAFTSRAQGTMAAAGAEPKPAGSIQVKNLLLSASTHQVKHDGVACLRDLDAFDKLPDRAGMPPTTDLESGYGGIRATCMMLTGHCEEGKKMYLAWLPVHSQPMDAAFFEGATNQVATQFCSVPVP